MIPQSIKDIVSSGENAGFFQSLALVIFLVFFVGLIIYVFSKPKKYYKEQEEAPLDDDQPSIF